MVRRWCSGPRHLWIIPPDRLTRNSNVNQQSSPSPTFSLVAHYPTPSPWQGSCASCYRVSDEICNWKSLRTKLSRSSRMVSRTNQHDAGPSETSELLDASIQATFFVRQRDQAPILVMIDTAKPFDRSLSPRARSILRKSMLGWSMSHVKTAEFEIYGMNKSASLHLRPR